MLRMEVDFKEQNKLAPHGPLSPLGTDVLLDAERIISFDGLFSQSNHRLRRYKWLLEVTPVQNPRVQGKHISTCELSKASLSS